MQVAVWACTYGAGYCYTHHYYRICSLLGADTEHVLCVVQILVAGGSSVYCPGADSPALDQSYIINVSSAAICPLSLAYSDCFLILYMFFESHKNVQ